MVNENRLSNCLLIRHLSVAEVALPKLHQLLEAASIAKTASVGKAA